MKILRKPKYIGIDLQMIEIQCMTNVGSNFAERGRIARVTLGNKMIGERVALVRVGGKDCVIRANESSNLPTGYEVSQTGILTSCDSSGAISIE